ncbi:MAG TPA: hypothetical protein VLG92_00740 [Candidatus Saccharimonadia bacterium]|nr:hypothetical protein [Candidatus Saccharimonadia bacterium]
MIGQAAWQWRKVHTRVLAYAGSAGFISLWTILRFFTQRTIFDLVGQQVLAQQLLHGGIAGAGVGITNYIPKLLFLYVPLHLLPGSPRLKLLLLTIVVNVATLVLLGLVLEKILHIFAIKAGALLWVGLLWVGAIAGSVFWIQFTNSRNLEVVGGVFLLYQGICYLERPSWRRLTVISLFTTILFFADTLQVYMTATPLVLYGLTLATQKRAFRSIGLLMGGLVASYIGSKLVFAGCIWLFSIHFIQSGEGAALSVHSLAHGMVGSLKAFVHLYSGGADAGKLRELCNFVFLATIISLSAYAIWNRLLPRRLLMLVGYIVVINELVYIASGQAGIPSTERYLIMTAPALVLLLGGLQASWKTFRPIGLTIIAIFISINGFFLTKSLATSSNGRFSQDAHLVSITRYIQHNPRTVVYASMDTAIPISYLYGSNTVVPLPLSCSKSYVVKDSTFYSKPAYRTQEGSAHTATAIILDGSAITNVPSTCSQEAITEQLGKPDTVTVSDDGSTILLYSANIGQKLHY